MQNYGQGKDRNKICDGSTTKKYPVYSITYSDDLPKSAKIFGILLKKAIVGCPQSVIWEEAVQKMPIHFFCRTYMHTCVQSYSKLMYMPYSYKVYTFTSKKWPPFFGGLLYNVERNLPLAHTLHVNEKKRVQFHTLLSEQVNLLKTNNLYHSMTLL